MQLAGHRVRPRKGSQPLFLTPLPADPFSPRPRETNWETNAKSLRFLRAVTRTGFVIYLDHNATTPILPEVLDAMMPYLTTEWGNPSSSYKFGAKLKSVIAAAREQVAELIDANSLDVVFTSCGTESNNAAITAALRANPAKRHIVTSQVEHSSVLNYCMALEGQYKDSPQRSQRTQSQAEVLSSVASVRSP